jgi:hypothetical protein
MHDTATAPGIPQPPLLVTAAGTPRCVGVEIEFTGLSALQAAEALVGALGGSLRIEDPHALSICNSRLGDLRVETDLRYVHPQRYRNLSLRLGKRAAAWLGTLVAPVVPRELVTAPLSFVRLREVDDAVAALRSAGASGHGAIGLDSLSVHFNIDPPALDAETLTAYLKAFLSVDEQLRQETARGSKRLAFVLPTDYPPAYRERVLAPAYWPDLRTFAADYLEANPTRRRALDLLPLLAHLDEAQVRVALPREKIGPRPVFHYRLPQAHVSDPSWSVLQDWERWLGVENLALKVRAQQANRRMA